MPGKSIGPAKSVVTRSPQELLERIDASLSTLTPKAKRLRTLAALSVCGGLLLTVGLTVVLWLFADMIVIWGLPLLLIGGGAAGMFMRAASTTEVRLAELHRERRTILKSIQNQPYGHAKPGTP